jgi:hypothetical protein
MVVFNAAQEEKSFLIGSGDWAVGAKGLTAGNASLEKADGSRDITIEPMSAMILVRGDETIVVADGSGAGKSDSAEAASEKSADNNSENSTSASGSGKRTGLAAGIVAGVLALAGIVALIFRKKK